MSAPDKLKWERTYLGRYDAIGREGDRWHVVQSASRRWDVYRNGRFYIDAVTMADARWYAEQEDDPAARETRDRLRRERVAARSLRFDAAEGQ